MERLDFEAGDAGKERPLACLIDLSGLQTHLERVDNRTLRAENDKVRRENIALKEALKNAICPSCGGPPPNEDSSVDEQELRMENARLKEEVKLSSVPLPFLHLISI